MNTITQEQTPLRIPSYDELNIEMLSRHDDNFTWTLRELASDELTRNPQGKIVLCNLEGSDKQIEWAFDIRKNAILKLKLMGVFLFRYHEGMDADQSSYNSFSELLKQHTHFQEGVNGLYEITSAKWWIDNRNEIGTALLRAASEMKQHNDDNMRRAAYSAQRALDAYNTRR